MVFRSIAGSVASSRFPPTPEMDPNPANVMRACIINHHGDPSVLEYTTTYPIPTSAHSASSHRFAKDDFVTVNIMAAGLNPVDFKMRKGPIANFIYPKPKIIGSDFAGVVESVPSTSTFKVGQRVFGMLPLLGSRYGTYAEKCCISESILAEAPEGISFTDLSTVPLVACTVVQAFRPVIFAYTTSSNLSTRPTSSFTRGKKCFIQAGSGGLGIYAIQYCANILGMHVVTSCSPRNFDLLKSLGACEVIDYHTEKIEDRVKDFDVYFDSMGYLNEQLVLSKSCHILKQDGTAHYIRIASSPYGSSRNNTDIMAMSRDPFGLAIPEARLDRIVIGYLKGICSRFFGRIKYHFILVRPEKEALVEFALAMKENKIRAVVQEVFPMQKVREAHELLESGHVTGKLSLCIQSQ